jgi:hypothetical protein
VPACEERQVSEHSVPAVFAPPPVGRKRRKLEVWVIAHHRSPRRCLVTDNIQRQKMPITSNRQLAGLIIFLFFQKIQDIMYDWNVDTHRALVKMGAYSLGLGRVVAA